MKKILLIIIALHFCVFDAVAQSNLYVGEVAVASQSEADRRDAIPDALLQVLQKLSGQRELPLVPALDEALNDAERMMLSFRYENVERTGSDGDVETRLHLVAQFIPAEADRVVQQLGLPRWQQERPSVQIWVVVDNGITRRLKPVEFAYAWQSIEDVAASRGLPVSWPDLDEEEMQLVDMRLLWGGFTDYLIERGAPADGVAIIAARREGPQWVLRWNVTNEVQNWSWRNADRELLFALAEGIHRMTDEVAASNSIAASEQGLSTVDLRIAGLTSSTAYIECMEYLQTVSLITDVEILGADPGQVHFRLRLNADPGFLADALRRGSVLLPASAGSEYDYVFVQ